MNSVRLLSILAFTMLFSYGCQEEFLPDNFHIGSEQGTFIQALDNHNTESCYGQENIIELDVDSDGNSDLKFYTYAMDSLGDQDKRGSSVWSLDGDIEFGYLIHYEDLYSVSEKTNKGKKEIIYNERSHFFCLSCQNLGKRKDRFSFSTPVLLEEGSELSRHIKWSDKLQILSQLDQSRQFARESDNTLVYNNIQTGIWDEYEEGYLPFRKRISFGKFQYGWIKLRVIDHRRLEFHEIGLQLEAN